MAQLIGQITELSGLFYVDEGGSSPRLLKSGDEVFEGNIIFGSTTNPPNSELKFSIVNSTEEVSILSDNQLLLDTTLLPKELPSESIANTDDIKSALILDSDEELAESDVDIEDLEETAAGDEADANDFVGRFGTRTAGETDISTDLRDGSFSDPTSDTLDEGLTIYENTVLSLSATPFLTEDGGTITYEASIDTIPLSDLFVTLSNGIVITIFAGTTSGTASVEVLESEYEDVYIDSDFIDVSITGISGGNFVNVDFVTNGSASTEIVDTIDETTVSLGATASISEAETTVTYTATLTNASEGNTVVTLDNGETITIGDGETSNFVNVTVPADEDPYVDPTSIEVAITNATGGNFENLTFDATPAVTEITDTIDETTVSLSGDTSVLEGDKATYTITVDNPPLLTPLQVEVQVVHNDTGDDDFDPSLTSLPFTQLIEIPIGATSVEFTLDTLSDGLAEGAESYEVSLSGSPTGGSFESVVLDTGIVTTTINDTTPRFMVGSDGDDIIGSILPFTVPPGGQGSITGAFGDDILSGDPGGSTIEAGSTANIVFVLDTSGSMDDNITFGGNNISRLEGMKLSVIKALEDMGASGADSVLVHIVEFSTDADIVDVGTYDITIDSELQAAIVAVDNITEGGWTNYEAGLVKAYDWITSSGLDAPIVGADINNLIFVSDGKPNRALDNDGQVTSTGSTTAMEHVLGTYNPSGTDNDDNINEVELIENEGFTVEAIGINVNTDNLLLLSQVEGTGGDATNVTTVEELSTVISTLSGATTVHDTVGDDTINGGEGDDLIFGDVFNTDTLAIDQGLSTPEGSGWLVFNQLENDPLSGWTRADTLDYIIDNQAELATESGRDGGNDVIYGGAGDDIIFAQEGDDFIDGGEGEDEVYGGSGDDTVVYDEDDAVTDGGTGYDSLIVQGITTLDFSSLDTNGVTNMEVIDLSGNPGTTVNNLTIESVFNITDDSNLLTIMGDTGDSVEHLLSEWNSSTGQIDIEGITYNQYEAIHSVGTVDSTVYLNIQASVDEEIV